MKSKLLSYFRVWLRLTVLQFQSQISNARFAAVILVLGKLSRLLFAFVTLNVIVGKTQALAGYNLPQAVFILALFSLIQTLSQLFFRGVYMFRDKVKDGTFDFYLLSPKSELFYSLFSYTDPLDLLTLLPYLGIVGWAWLRTGFPVTVPAILLIIFCLLISLLFVFGIHVLVIAVGVRYLEVDNTIMLYRDVERMAAFPINMYGKYGTLILTYLLPFALMATIPANLVFGLFNPWSLLIFAVITLVEVKLALAFWHHSLSHYTSASS